MAAFTGYEDALAALYNIEDLDVYMMEHPDDPTALFPPDITAIPDFPKSVQRDQKIDFIFTWKQTGWDAGFVMPYEFLLEVFLERMGKEEANDDFSKVVAYAVGDGHVYTGPEPVITIDANTLDPGVYNATAVWSLRYEGTEQTPVSAFCELGKFRVYRAD